MKFQGWYPPHKDNFEGAILAEIASLKARAGLWNGGLAIFLPRNDTILQWFLRQHKIPYHFLPNAEDDVAMGSILLLSVTPGRFLEAALAELRQAKGADENTV